MLVPVVLSVALAFLVQERTQGDAAETAKTELLAHAARLAEAKSYVLEYGGSSAREDEAEGDPGRGRSAGRGGDPWRIEFERGKPVHFLRGRYDFWLGEKKFSYKDARERWSTIDRPDPEKRKAVEGSDEPRIFKTFEEVERVPLPHLVVADLAGAVTGVTRAESEGGIVYVATLTSDAARKFGGLKPRKPAGASKEPECAGTLRVTVAEDAIEKLEVEVTVKAANERRLTRTFELSAIDSTTLDLPPEVAAAQAGGT